MGGSPGTSALSFLLNTVVDLYVMLVALRYIMQVVRADYYNPVAQFIVKATTPALTPFRKIVPGWGKQDTAALLFCWLTLIAKLFLFKFLSLGVISIAGNGIVVSALGPVTIIALAAVDLLALFFNIFFFAIIIMAVLSWVSPSGHNPIAALVSSICEPLISPVRRYIPPLGGMDLSPLVVLIGLQVLKILVIGTLMNLF